MNTGKTKSRNISDEPYPMNLLIALNEHNVMGTPLSLENMTQDNFDGLDVALTTLPERVQEMIRLRFVERQAYSKIGEPLGIGAERVRFLIQDGLRKLRYPSAYAYIKYGKQGNIERRAKLAEENKAVLIDKLQIKVTDMGISVRATNRLIAVGCRTVKDVVALNEEKIKNIRNLGKLSIQEIASKLESMGIKDTDWSKF